MALTVAETKQVVSHFKTSELDTGSPKVQIALLTFKIQKLTEHMKANKHDYHSRSGLMAMVNRRRKLLSYLKSKSEPSYKKTILELGIRK